MSIELVSVQIQVGKETKEVIDAVVALVIEAKKVKSAAEIPAALMKHLEQVWAGVQGFQSIPEENKGPALKGTVGYAGHEIVGALQA